jgi:radical SAM superfamily enzyme YgiQ (UPF0313 family)
LYAILRQNTEIFPDLAFVPPLRDTVQMRRENIPWWLGVGTKRSPLDFDCIAISNALVQELVNLAPTLVASGIPLAKSERLAHSEIPLLILGGANSMHSSMLWTQDPLVDGIFIGEEPQRVETVFKICAEGKLKGISKIDILEQLEAEVPGFFQPERLADPHNKVVIEKAHESTPRVNCYKPFEPMVAGVEVAGVAALHISEGCPSFCSFCAESFARKPYREVPMAEAIPQAMAMKAALGLEEIELFSFNFNNHAQVHELVPALATRFGRVGLKSQRFDALAEDPALVGLMRQVGKSSITCGLEGVSDRVRSYLQKGLSESQLREALSAMMREPLRELKVFLIASGVEEAADFEEFREFLKWFKHLYDRATRRPRVTFSATPLVRFPWTPLEFEDGMAAEECGKRVRQIKDCVVRAGFDFREAASEWEAEVSQIMVRARDPRILQAVITAQERTGELYAETLDQVFVEALRKSLGELGLNWQECLRGHLHETRVPWESLSPGVSRKFLIRMHAQSVTCLQQPICLGSVARAGKCSACDACTPGERTAITASRKPPSIEVGAFEKALKDIRSQEREVRIRVVLDARCKGWPWKTLAAWLMQGLMAECPSLVDGFRRHLAGDWEQRLDDEFCQVVGESDLAFSLLASSREDLERLLRHQASLKNINQKLAGWMLVQEIAPAIALCEKLELHLPKGIFSPEDWLRAKGLKHTLTKQGERRVYQFSKDSLKKKVLTELWIELGQQEQIMTIVPAEKFELRDFLKNCAKTEQAEDWRRIWVQSHYKR